MITHTQCQVDGCKKSGTKRPNGTVTFKKGYCTTHYSRLLVHGDINMVKPHFTKDNKTSEHPLCNTYHQMKARCINKTSKPYRLYGGRGIQVCDRWLGKNGFFNFCNDMGEKPTPKHTLDRIDVNGNYEPSNCRWATTFQQSCNRRNQNKCVGVGYHAKPKKWRVRISIKNESIFLGQFDSYSEAVSARRAAELKYFGYNV